MTELITAAAAPLAALDATAAEADAYHAQARAEATLRAYRADWRAFETWCAAHQLPILPAAPETVALYITELARDHKVSTITRHLASIAQAHKEQQYESPTRAAVVQNVLKGIRRAKGTAPTQKAAAEIAVIRAMVAALSPTLQGIRDRAILLVGFAGAFRRSELASLRLDDIQFTNDGVVVTLRHSKTDQEGEGYVKGIPYGSTPSTCPVRALRAWLDASGISAGPLFRSVWKGGRQLRPTPLGDRAIAEVVKRAAQAAGYDPSRFGGHSLRAGLVTTAAAAGVDERTIMEQTGHKTTTMVRRYMRRGSLFRNNAAAKVGL
jgi:integrase